MDNTEFLLSKFSYIFSQPLSPLSQYLMADNEKNEITDSQTKDESDDAKLET